MIPMFKICEQKLNVYNLIYFDGNYAIISIRENRGNLAKSKIGR